MELGTKTVGKTEIEKGFCPPGKDLPVPPPRLPC